MKFAFIVGEEGGEGDILSKLLILDILAGVSLSPFQTTHSIGEEDNHTNENNDEIEEFGGIEGRKVRLNKDRESILLMVASSLIEVGIECEDPYSLLLTPPNIPTEQTILITLEVKLPFSNFIFNYLQYILFL